MEKMHLVKEGKIKAKDAAMSIIFKGEDNKYYEKVGSNTLDISEEIPFELPDSWSWCRLSSIALMRIGKTPARGDSRFWASPQYNWVSISDMSDYGHITGTKEQVSEVAAKESFHGQLSQPGDLLMSFKLTVGRTSILDIPAFHNEAIVTIRPILDSSMLLRDWLFTILPVVANMGDSKDAIKGKTLNSQSLAALLVPVAPLGETKRILVKYNDVSKHLQ